MPLVPYDPFRNLENMRRELDRFFTLPFTTGMDTNFGVPRIDIYETENEVIASCDLPGLEKKEDVNIGIENNVLSISGKISRVKDIKEEQLHRQERFVGRFQRSITLPANVSPEGIKATYKNGVLEVRIPKAKTDTRRRIDVEFH
ncbi:MAG: hypothetical protein PWQ67_1973 [Clostridia bacterium]|nr:hypothetical protein [Clostridia bacterium]MDN5323519.1 hypothetical protein [Clostridia bacterium]